MRRFIPTIMVLAPVAFFWWIGHAGLVEGPVPAGLEERKETFHALLNVFLGLAGFTVIAGICGALVWAFFSVLRSGHETVSALARRRL